MKPAPWMPSNGTELERFIAAHCIRCSKDTNLNNYENKGKQCGILDRAMREKQPRQWITNPNTERPACTSFRQRGERLQGSSTARKDKTTIDMFTGKATP